MVQFKSWRDAYLYMKEYGNFTCLNCQYGRANLDTGDGHSDTHYARMFCREWVAMVHLEKQFVCEKWKHRRTGETLNGNLDCDMWNIPEEVAEIIDEDGTKWSFEEIRGLVDEKSKE